MNELPRRFHNDTNGLDYQLHGDYYFPDISVEQELPLDRHGLSRMVYLREFRPGLFSRLLLTGRLYDDLHETETEAKRLLDIMMPQMAKDAGADDNLKAHDQMKWVGLMNSIKNQIEEIIWDQVVYR